MWVVTVPHNSWTCLASYEAHALDRGYRGWNPATIWARKETVYSRGICIPNDHGGADECSAEYLHNHSHHSDIQCRTKWYKMIIVRNILNQKRHYRNKASNWLESTLTKSSASAAAPMSIASICFLMSVAPNLKPNPEHPGFMKNIQFMAAPGRIMLRYSKRFLPKGSVYIFLAVLIPARINSPLHHRDPHNVAKLPYLQAFIYSWDLMRPPCSTKHPYHTSKYGQRPSETHLTSRHL